MTRRLPATLLPSTLLPITLLATALLAITAMMTTTSCLFLPAIDDDGYVACASDDDCAAGRSCIAGFGRCAPPPWNDETFEVRRLLVVENPSDVELPAGAAIPVPLGGDGDVLTLGDIDADHRFTQFDLKEQAWQVVGVYEDIVDGRGVDEDTFVAWIPLQRALPAGARDALAYLEQQTADGTPTLLANPEGVFALFDDLDVFVVAGDDDVFVDAPNADPVVREGEIVVGDNQKVVWRKGLVPPLSVTFRARINGLTCREVFLGVTASASSSFDLPAAGLFVDDDLLTVGQFAPVAAAQILADVNVPTIIDEQPNALHRYTINVDVDAVQFLVDGVVFGEDLALTTPFEPVELLPTVEVGGDCSVDVDAVWVTPLTPATPKVTAEDPVLFNTTF